LRIQEHSSSSVPPQCDQVRSGYRVISVASGKQTSRQGPAADDDGNVYVVTGYGSWDGMRNFSESFLKLTPQLKLLDWFTPTNHFALDKRDIDLDSSGATLIPGTHLVLGGGKEGILYTLDARNLGHLGDEHTIQHFPATVSHLHSLVFWQSANNGDCVNILRSEHLAEIPVARRRVPKSLLDAAANF